MLKLILTNLIQESHGEYFDMIVIYIQKVLNLLLYVDITFKVLEFLHNVINVKLLKLLL